jgi:hypothetical protein
MKKTLQRSFTLRFSLIIYISFLDSCNEPQKFKYETGILKYFDSIELDEKFNEILIIPIDGCAVCINSALLYLDQDSLWLDAVIIAGPAIQKKTHIGKTIIRYDQEKKLSQFETGIYSPYLVKRRNNKIIQAIELNTDSLQEFEALINNQIN